MQMELQINRAKFSSILQTHGVTHSPNRQSRILLHPPSRWSNSFSKLTEQNSPPSSMQMELQIVRANSILLHPPCRWSSKSTEQNSLPSSKHMELLILQIVRAESSSILQVDGATHSPNQQSKILLHPPCRWSSKSTGKNPPPSFKQMELQFNKPTISSIL